MNEATRVAGIQDRAVGALVGLAAGDAVGTTLEFKQPGTFAPITDMVGGGPFGLPPGAFTDDTSMAMCLAESILDTGGLDAHDQLRRYVMWWREGYWSSTGRCFDIGNTTTAALGRYERTGAPIDSVVDQESAANGSAMRLAPVPIRWHADLAEAAERSAESSRTTHAADRPVDVCRLLGAVIAALVRGDDADEVLDPGFWDLGALHPQVEAVARGSWRTREPPQIRGTGFCVDALEAALWAVGGASDFREAALRAANLGDDADTTAAIAGQIAGARWGWSGIPEEWRSRVKSEGRIRAIALRLAAAGLADAGDHGPWPHDPDVHGFWVEPGSFLAGEYPGHPDPDRARDRVNLLIDHGVRTFIDLTRPEDGLAPYAAHVTTAAERRGLDVRHAPFPIPDMSVRDDPDYDLVVDMIREATGRGVAYVHCWGGVGRTGTVIGCHLVDAGLSADDALAELSRVRQGTRKAHRPAPENRTQEGVIRRRASGS